MKPELDFTINIRVVSCEDYKPTFILYLDGKKNT